ncbi:hypothetical protein GCM10023149_29240 [Mucilaginibacter gynuensis]|uniref:Uncharacterized protein n=1 Tax=Mucilaginibacter gynuensis TaxID=1302236 RepID=A0ABP8GL79_9SPHI
MLIATVPVFDDQRQVFLADWEMLVNGPVDLLEQMAQPVFHLKAGDSDNDLIGNRRHRSIRDQISFGQPGDSRTEIGDLGKFKWVHFQFS